MLGTIETKCGTPGPATTPHGIHLQCHTSIKDVPRTIWGSFARRDAIGLEAAHLHAVEESGINDIHSYYIIGYHGDEPVGIAYCFSIQVDLAGMANTYPAEVLKTVKTWKPGFMQVRIVEVGHIASLGMTVEVTGTHLAGFLRSLAEMVDDIARAENAELCFFRDIDTSRFSSFQVLEESGYRPVKGFPVARMKLRWGSFEGYLAALKAKKRYNIQKSRMKLRVPEIAVDIIDDYAQYSERLCELWTNVAGRNNGYSHEHLTPSFFESMCRRLGGRSHVVAIKLRGEIVAYGLNLIGDDVYFGMAEGLAYEVRDAYDLYTNNILEGLRVACELRKKTYNIGITAYDFKTSIGAELDPCFYFVKATQNPAYSAVYADLFDGITRHKEHHHRVFRNSDDQSPARPEKDTVPCDAGGTDDPFQKHYRYIRVDTARSAGLYAYCPVFESSQEPVIKHRSRDVVMLGTNSYLGLSTHPKVKRAMHEAIDRYGSGCSGSPLLNGTLDLHERLASALAGFTKKQAALVFSTGYQTNVGTISALVNRDDVVVMDKRSHASLVDGARLSGATLARYEHNDMDSLEAVLARHADKPKLIVTDSYFSMEGTVARLPELVGLARHYRARLMLDESHAIGVFGRSGRGVAEHFNLLDDVDIVMGTFSKAFASIGGFVAGEEKIIDTLRHRSRSHVFSASLPPSAVAAVLVAISIVDEEPERRTRLLENAGVLASGLGELGFEIGNHGGPIIPVSCGHELIALAAFQKLFDEGVFVNPVTWPAVPKNEELLRVSVMATHDRTMLARALDAFGRIRTPNWPSGGRNGNQRSGCPH